MDFSRRLVTIGKYNTKRYMEKLFLSKKPEKLSLVSGKEGDRAKGRGRTSHKRGLDKRKGQRREDNNQIHQSHSGLSGTKLSM